MKRILTFILALTMLISPQYLVKAAQNIEILVNETYNDAVTHTIPKTVTTEGDGSVFYVKKLEQGKGLYMRHRWVDTSVTVKTEISEEVVWIDTSVLLPDLKTSRNVIEVRTSDNVYPLVTVDKAGMVRDISGQQVYRVNKEEWHRYTVELNLITGKYDIYVDGTRRAERVLIPEAPKSITASGFRAVKNTEVESEFVNKYFRVYKADKLPGILDIEEAAYNYDEKKLKKDEVKEVEEKTLVYYTDDFQDIAAGGKPEELSPTGGAQAVETDATGNYFSFKWTKGNGVQSNYYTNNIGLTEMPDSVVFEVDVRAGKNTGDFYLFSLRDGADPYHFSRIIRIMEDGTVANYNGTPLGDANCKNKWVSVQVITDFKTKTHDYYIDRQLVADNVPFQTTATVQKMSMLRCHIDTATGKGKLDIDNIKMYSGSKLVDDFSDAASSVVEMPEKVEVWEHEISKTPLNIDMSQYKAAPVYSSESTNFLKNFEAGKAAFKDTICIVADSYNLWINDKKYISPYKVTWDDNEKFLAPAEFLASLSKEKVTYSNGTVSIGNNFSAKIGENAITVGGTRYETKATVQDIGGVAYIPVKEYVVYKLNKYCCESYKGLAIIADKQVNINNKSNTDNVIQMLAHLAFDLPDKETLRAAYDASSLKGVHPRVYKTNEGFREILKLAETDEILKARLDGIKKEADGILDYKFTYNKTSGTGSYNHCEKLYFAWLMTGDDRYAAKAEELALLMANDPNWWEVEYYLATSANMVICATVYDLFYDYLSDQSKEIIATAAIEKGVKAAQRSYNGQCSDWPRRKTNWNTVPNGGSIMAAATFLGEGYDDEACLDVLEKCFYSLANVMHVYSAGSAFEGIGYFGYGTEYLIKAVIALNSLFGTDYGISNYTGFLESGYYGFYTQTHLDKWALHDDTLKSGFANSIASYFAYRTNDMMLQKMRHDQIINKKYTADLNDIVYYMPEKMPEKIAAPLDRNFSYTEIATSRSSWDRDAFFLGVHAGANNFEHGQQDLGNFIYEAFGLRFAHDIGRDSYNLPNYFNEGTTKLTIYAHRAEAHNVYVINPSEDSGQVWRAKSEIEIQENKPKGIIYTVDMTPAYFEQLKEAKRGYMLTNDRSVLVVQDEIVPKEEDDEYKWFWTTEADIQINEDKTVTLTNSKKTVTLYLDSNVDFELESGETVPLETSPNPAGQLEIGNKANKLTVTFYAEEQAMDKIYFRVIAVPYGHDDYEIGEITPISDWTIPDGDINKNFVNADRILVNGKPIAEFSPELYDYTQYYAKHQGLPTVTAEANGEVTIRQAEDKYKTAVVTVTSSAGVKRFYTITFQSEIASGVPDGTKMKVAAVVAEDSDDNVPAGAIDGDLNTRWSGKTTDKGWIQLDLGEVKTIDAVALAVLKGDTRAAIFDILVSEDGANYTTVIKNGRTSGTTAGLEYVQFEPVKARYVKLIGYGATTSRYNSYTEIQVYKTN